MHTPRNLAASISIEAGELLEHFQWRTDEEVERHLAHRREDIAEELADVAVYLLHLADTVGVDLEQAVDEKIRRNELRFPPLRARAQSA